MIPEKKITKDMITGALDGSMTIDNRIFTPSGWSSIGNDFKNFGSNAKKTGQGLWDLPMTSAGLGYGGLNMIFGFLTGDKVTVQQGEKGIEFIGGKLGAGGNCEYQNCGSAITLGKMVNYFGNLNPDSVDQNSSYTGLPIIVGPHENRHVDQYKKYGPLFPFIYFVNGGISSSNKLEIEADKKGNEAYKNKYNK